MKYLRFGFTLFALFCSMIAVHAQTATVTAEAIGQANLRAAPDVNADLRRSDRQRHALPGDWAQRPLSLELDRRSQYAAADGLGL